MARILTSGFDEVPDASGLTLTHWDTVVGTVNVVATPSPRRNALSTHCAQFPASAQNFLSRSMNPNITSGKAYVRSYVMFSDFGGAANSYGTLWQWTNSGGTGNVSVKFNASTKHFQVFNVITNATVTGAVTVVLNKWYRVEMEAVVSATTTGSVTVKIFDGDYPDPVGLLETLSIAGNATIASGGQFTACQIGNRSSVNWGTLQIDDVAMNNDTDNGDGQISWCGPGCALMTKPNGPGDTTQWTPNGVSQNWDAVDDLPTVDPTTGTNNSTTSTTAIDNFSLSPLPVSLPDNAVFTLLDIYSYSGGSSSTATADIALAIWDENNIHGTGPVVFINTTTWLINRSNEHYSSSIVGVTKTQINAYKIGYQSLNGATLTKKVATLWAQVEYQPDVSTPATGTAASPYVASGRLAPTKTHNFTGIATVVADEVPNHESTGILSIHSVASPHEALGTVHNIQQAISLIESLISVSQGL